MGDGLRGNLTCSVIVRGVVRVGLVLTIRHNHTARRAHNRAYSQREQQEQKQQRMVARNHISSLALASFAKAATRQGGVAVPFLHRVWRIMHVGQPTPKSSLEQRRMESHTLISHFWGKLPKTNTMSENALVLQQRHVFQAAAALSGLQHSEARIKTPTL